jgi:hypothetical protein
MEEASQTKIARVLKLPSLVNWARQNFRRLDDTRRRIQQLADFPPKHSLGQVYDICSAIAYRELSPSKIDDRIEEIENPFARISAREVIPAFLETASKRGFDGIKELHGRTLPIPIGRGPDSKPLLIPIRPTFVLADEDKLKPVFLIGWARLTLTDYQKRLLSTIIERSYLTQQDFIGSDAEILCFPRIAKTRRREARSWLTKQIPLLSDDEVADQFERYSLAVREVVESLRAR